MKKSDEVEGKSPHESGDEDSDEDESQILEESPCGRWSKRRQQVIRIKMKFYFEL